MGYIIAGVNVSPNDVVSRRAQEVPPVTLVSPPLKAWSDIVAIQWKMQAVPQMNGIPRSLQYIFRAGISNENTLARIGDAFRIALGVDSFDTDEQIEDYPWPGKDFAPTDENPEPFLGLLGTYHAAGPAYMLAQHQSLFGALEIKKIRVFEGLSTANMLLFVGPVV